MTRYCHRHYTQTNQTQDNREGYWARLTPEVLLAMKDLCVGGHLAEAWDWTYSRNLWSMPTRWGQRKSCHLCLAGSETHFHLCQLSLMTISSNGSRGRHIWTLDLSLLSSSQKSLKPVTLVFSLNWPGNPGVLVSFMST